MKNLPGSSNWLYVSAIPALVIFGCIDLREDVIPEPVAVPVVTARLEIHPPEFARTAETATEWTKTVKVAIPVKLESAMASGGTQDTPDDGHDGHMHKALSPLAPTHGGEPHGEEQVDTATGGATSTGGAGAGHADTAAGGLNIALHLDSGRALYRHINGMWMAMQPDSLGSYMSIHLSPSGHEEGGQGPTAAALAYSTVVVKVVRDSAQLDSATLRPAFGHNGLFYTANLTLTDTGAVTVEVSASAPTDCGRDEQNKNRLKDAWATSFVYTNKGSPAAETAIGDTTFGDGVKMGLTVAAPKTLWLWNGSSPVRTPPAASATHALSVRLHDTKSLASERAVPYAEVHCTVLSEDGSLSSGTAKLAPIHSADGLRYSANMSVPMPGVDMPSGGDTDKADDGHDHQH